MGKHRTNLVSLCFGLLFLGASGYWAADRYLKVDLPDAGWLFAGGLVLAGLVGVASSLRRPRPE